MTVCIADGPRQAQRPANRPAKASCNIRLHIRPRHPGRRRRSRRAGRRSDSELEKCATSSVSQNRRMRARTLTMLAALVFALVCVRGSVAAAPACSENSVVQNARDGQTDTVLQCIDEAGADIEATHSMNGTL